MTEEEIGNLQPGDLVTSTGMTGIFQDGTYSTNYTGNWEVVGHPSFGGFFNSATLPKAWWVELKRTDESDLHAFGKCSELELVV